MAFDHGQQNLARTIFGRPGDDEVKWQVTMLRVQPGVKWMGIVCGHAVLGAWVHFYHGQSSPCIGRENRCLPCECGAAVRWQGYLDVLDTSGSRLWVANVTRGAYLSCLDVRDEKLDLRGRYIKLERAGGRPNSPLKMELGKQSGRTDIREPLDLEAFLFRLWGLHPRTTPPTA